MVVRARKEKTSEGSFPTAATQEGGEVRLAQKKRPNRYMAGVFALACGALLYLLHYFIHLLTCAKGRGQRIKHMKRHNQGNYVRMHRKRSGLSQRELALILGYRNQWQVSRHERSKSTPTLNTAVAYAVTFGVPVSAIFVGIHLTATKAVEENLKLLENKLHHQNAKGREAQTIAQKVRWLTDRTRE